MTGSAFAIDFRSLRFFRGALGAILLVDLLLRAKDFTSLHTEAGVLPSQFFPYKVSLFFLSNSPIWTAILFGAMAVCGILLILNLRPRTVSLVTFVLLLSLRNRNPFVTYGGDDLLRIMLIWSAFLPSGPRSDGEKNFVNAAAIAVFVQLFALYFCAGMNKVVDAWWEDGRATYLALHGGSHARAQAAILLNYPDLLVAASRAVFILERFGWILFFLPFWHARGRMLGCALFIGMHLSFGLFLHLELFPLIDSTLVLLFLPSEFWDKLKVHARFPTIRPPAFEAASATAALSLIIVITANNVSQLPQIEREIWRPMRLVSAALGLNQRWNMFTPIHNIADTFHTIIASSPDGKKVDLLNQREITQLPQRPLDSQSEQRGFRWTKYLDSVAHNSDKKFQQGVLDYLCRPYKGWQVEWYVSWETTIAAAGVKPIPDIVMLQKQVCD